MSDFMLLGILRMPIEADGGIVAFTQFRSAARSAADRIEALTAQLESTLQDRKLILGERDRTFSLMLTRTEAAEAERDRLRAVLVVLADDSNWFSTYDLGAEVIASWRGNGEPDDIARAALKGETP